VINPPLVSQLSPFLSSPLLTTPLQLFSLSRDMDELFLLLFHLNNLDISVMRGCRGCAAQFVATTPFDFRFSFSLFPFLNRQNLLLQPTAPSFWAFCRLCRGIQYRRCFSYFEPRYSYVLLFLYPHDFFSLLSRMHTDSHENFSLSCSSFPNPGPAFYHSVFFFCLLAWTLRSIEKNDRVSRMYMYLLTPWTICNLFFFTIGATIKLSYQKN
jgi:hypothetical protein